MLVHLNCPKREKTAFFGRKQTNYPLKSWKTVFFELLAEFFRIFSHLFSPKNLSVRKTTWVFAKIPWVFRKPWDFSTLSFLFFIFFHKKTWSEWILKYFPPKLKLFSPKLKFSANPLAVIYVEKKTGYGHCYKNSCGARAKHQSGIRTSGKDKDEVAVSLSSCGTSVCGPYCQ